MATPIETTVIDELTEEIIANKEQTPVIGEKKKVKPLRLAKSEEG